MGGREKGLVGGSRQIGKGGRSFSCRGRRWKRGFPCGEEGGKGFLWGGPGAEARLHRCGGGGLGKAVPLWWWWRRLRRGCGPAAAAEPWREDKALGLQRRLQRAIARAVRPQSQLLLACSEAGMQGGEDTPPGPASQKCQTMGVLTGCPVKKPHFRSCVGMSCHLITLLKGTDNTILCKSTQKKVQLC